MTLSYFMIIFVFNIIHVLVFINSPSSIEENKFFENSQLLILCTSILCFLFGSIRCKFRIFGLLLSLFCLILVLRELDIRNIFTNSDVLAIMTTIKYLSSTLAIVLFFIFLFKLFYLRYFKYVIIPYFKKLIIAFTLIGILSIIFDKNAFQTNYNVFLEELLEINAYLILLISSIVYNKNFRLMPKV